MYKEIEEFFKKEKIEYFGILPMSECIFTRKYLLDREEGFAPKSVICFAVPYYTQEGINISKYAVSHDYHNYMKSLASRLGEYLENTFAGARAFGFSDHSPVLEVPLAAKCGLGIIGENGLLITEKYSSFVFIGEVFTNIDAEKIGYVSAEEIKICAKCGKCKKRCPTNFISQKDKECLSAITQKKGELSQMEKTLIIANNTAWGCDKCQDVCPYTKKAIENNTAVTPIEFFHEKNIAFLDSKTIDEMEENEFILRAYSWRKRETIKRNLVLLEEATNEENSPKPVE